MIFCGGEGEAAMLFTLDVIFVVTQMAILFALIAGLAMMSTLKRKLDRDVTDRELMRTHLFHNAQLAKERIEAVDPVRVEDRRQAPPAIRRED